MSFDEFVEFHKKHPDMDNAEYYAEFPDVNKSTIRSWKSRARDPAPPSTPDPTPKEVIDTNGYEEQTKHYIEMLMTQTKSKPKEFEGVDDKSKILILRNRLNLQKETQDKKPAGNSSIMPSSAAIGQVVNAPGLWDYVTFDKNQNEIRMEIPLSQLMDPEENKALRK